jgi:hypothetical protein
LPRNRAPKTQRLFLLAQIAGLLATGCVVWFASLVPRMNHQSLAGLLAEAFEYALMAWAWSAAVTFGLFLMIPKAERGDVFGITLRTASTAVWFAPATILLSMFSPAALAAALVLAVNTTRLLCSDWRPAYADRRLPESLFPALAISAAFQAAIVAVLMKYPLVGAAFFLMSAAMLTLLTTVTGVWETGRPASLPRSILGVLLTVILAATLTVGGLATGGRGGWRWDFFARPSSGEGPDAASDQLASKFYKPTPRSVDLTDNSYPGVILWPEVKPVTVLVAPMPALAHSRLGLALANPLSIPFSGEYWMFKPPLMRPPPTSFFRRGNPAALFFRTTDHRPLLMEARHKLDQPIDLRCCGGIQIVVSNADRYPGTVALELVLRDTHAPQSGSLSLGKAAVTSRPDLMRDPIAPASETLDFPIPRSTALGRFDEFIVLFHRDPMRMDRSARIAIERFVLAPRGD